MTQQDLTDAFPLPYAYWYAASLFLEAGHPAGEVLARLGVDAEVLAACRERYDQLHFANTGWVASAYQRAGFPPPEDDRALYDHLTAGDGIEQPAYLPLSMRRELASLRRLVEGNPRIGPFADVDWMARYICERRFPVIRYIQNGDQVFVGGSPIHDRKGKALVGVDPTSFRQLGERWFCDANRVYGQGETPTKRFWFAARGADPASFTVLNERYGADKAAGYYITNLRLPTEEPGTFGIVSYYYGRGQKPGIHVDESHYAKDSKKVYAYGVAIEGADAPSFHAIGDEGHYFADKNRIYWDKTPIVEADLSSFTCASEAGQYRAYDKNRPYYAGKPQSVSAEFERWDKFFEAHPEITDSWWHREKARRAPGHSSHDAIAPIGGPYFSDGERVIVRPQWVRDEEWISLDHFDHNSFHHIVDVFGRDQHGLRYFVPGLERYGAEAVKGADPASFERVADRWFRDSGQAYYFDSTAAMPTLAVVKADMSTFELLGGAYARDAKGLIVEGVRKKKIADSGAVVGIGYLFARMGDTLLYRGKPITKPGKVDPATARGVHDQLLIDGSGHMLFGSMYRKPIPDLDPVELHFINNIFAVDASSVYVLNGNKLIRCEGINRSDVEPMGQYAVRSGGVKFHISGDRLYRTDLEVDESSDTLPT